jgi:hypothetical protein
MLLDTTAPAETSQRRGKCPPSVESGEAQRNRLRRFARLRESRRPFRRPAPLLPACVYEPLGLGGDTGQTTQAFTASRRRGGWFDTGKPQSSCQCLLLYHGLSSLGGLKGHCGSPTSLVSCPAHRQLNPVICTEPCILERGCLLVESKSPVLGESLHGTWVERTSSTSAHQRARSLLLHGTVMAVPAAN